MNTEKIKEVFSDEAFVKSLFELKTAAEVQAALKEKGLEFTEEEIMAIRDLLLRVEKGEVTPEQLRRVEEGELSDEELELVSGGFALHIVIGVISLILVVASVVDWATDGEW